MDTYLAVTSKRDSGRYSDQPIANEVASRILEAGRVAGSARNRQPWTFWIADRRDDLDRIAQTVFEPSNLASAALAIVIVTTGKGPVSFDAGRAAQNMMLAAWSDGIGSTPNGVADRDGLADLLGLDREADIEIVLSFGYPRSARNPAGRSPTEWIAKADRKPLEEVTRKVSPDH